MSAQREVRALKRVIEDQDPTTPPNEDYWFTFVAELRERVDHLYVTLFEEDGR